METLVLLASINILQQLFQYMWLVFQLMAILAPSEIYGQTGSEIACGQYDDDIINWSNQKTIGSRLI